MKRVVITGMGIVSPLGNDLAAVTDALRKGRSGVVFKPEYKKKGLRSHVAGAVNANFDAIDRKDLRFMGATAAYAYLSMCQALVDAGLERKEIQDPRIGVVAASGAGSTPNEIEAVDTLRARGIRRVSPFLTPKIMSNTVSANLATAFGIKGLNYSITSACSTSAHCIGHAYEQIQLGKQDIIFAGGAEEEHWAHCLFFDAMRAASTKYNDTPETACRPYDVNRDGMVMGSGGGILVLEEFERANARGAKIYGEIVGYAANSDGKDMVAPSGEGAARCMREALKTVDEPVDYVNTHGTGTPVGDITELKALRDVFGDDLPLVSSTKALTGHALGAAGVHESIYCLLMMQAGFAAASHNIQTLDPAAENYPIVRETKETNLTTAMSNSFGFGGTNAALVFRKCE